MSNNDLFDIKMKEKFQEEISEIPENINESIDNALTLIRYRKNRRTTKKKKIAISAAAILCISITFMQTSYAKNLVNDIIRYFSLSNIKIYENTDYKWKDKEMPEAAKGKVFDKNKNIIEKITLENKDEMYDANGEKVFDVEDDGTLITEKVQKENMEKNARENPVENLIVKDISKLNNYTCFDVKLPTYLPEGFKFDCAEFFKEDDGKIPDVFIHLYFKNSKTGKEIYMSQTYICKESSGETSFNNIEKIKVNGADAIVGDEGIVWEANGIRYLMYTDFGKSENVKIAESIK